MSKFIKVTEVETGKNILVNTASIFSIKRLKTLTRIDISSDYIHVCESLEQIEAQLLRDEFAMAALPSFINTRVTVEQATRQAYVYADAMLKERLK